MMAAQLASVDLDGSRTLPRIGKHYCRECGLEDEGQTGERLGELGTWNLFFG